MLEYRDINGYYHDKPCLDGKPSSNNPLIYTAYAKALGFKIKSKICYEVVPVFDFQIIRMKGKDDSPPPFSKDEFLGFVILFGYNPLYDWNISKFTKIKSYIKTFKAMWYLRNKHRNTVWKENIYPAYPIAYSIPRKMRHFTMLYIGKKSNIINTIAFYFGVLTTGLISSAGSKNMLWLQLEMLKHPLRGIINQPKNFKEYFGEDHIFVRGQK